MSDGPKTAAHVPDWLQQERDEQKTAEAKYRARYPGNVSGEPTMMIRVVIGGKGGGVPYLKLDDDATRRPPMGRYACFWIGDE
jgi:hypothetical protein